MGENAEDCGGGVRGKSWGEEQAQVLRSGDIARVDVPGVEHLLAVSLESLRMDVERRMDEWVCAQMSTEHEESDSERAERLMRLQAEVEHVLETSPSMEEECRKVLAAVLTRHDLAPGRFTLEDIVEGKRLARVPQDAIDVCEWMRMQLHVLSTLRSTKPQTRTTAMLGLDQHGLADEVEDCSCRPLPGPELSSESLSNASSASVRSVIPGEQGTAVPISPAHP